MQCKLQEGKEQALCLADPCTCSNKHNAWPICIDSNIENKVQKYEILENIYFYILGVHKIFLSKKENCTIFCYKFVSQYWFIIHETPYLIQISLVFT
jgi:hypothetical protein